MKTLESDARSPMLQLAEVGCLCTGLAILTWGIAATMIELAATGFRASFSAAALNGVVFLVGGVFLAMRQLIRRRVTWALKWAAGMSLALFLTTVGSAFVIRTHVANTYLIVLALGNALACWLAVEERGRVRQPPSQD